MTETTDPIPHYFVVTAEGFDPTGLSRNPWFADAVAGGPVSALFGHIIEQAGFDPGFEICRVTIDILGVVPRALLVPRVVPVRTSSTFKGEDWIGLKMRDVSVVRGIGVLPIFAGLIGLLLLIGSLAATWAREGR